MTSKQQRVLDYLQRYIAEHRCPPFIREIQAGCQITSYKSTVDRLNALERKGFIRRRPNKHRAIRIVHKPLEPQPHVGASSFETAPEEPQEVPRVSASVQLGEV